MQFNTNYFSDVPVVLGVDRFQTDWSSVLDKKKLSIILAISRSSVSSFTLERFGQHFCRIPLRRIDLP